MKTFRDIDDIEVWLAPMDYQGFWVATAPYELALQSREHCDRQIASKIVDTDTVLGVLKSMTRMELTKRHDLHWKAPTPWLKLVDSH